MSLRKFDRNDIILNTMRTYPPVEFFIYDSNIYYNKQPRQSGEFGQNVLGISTASISLYEYNIDRAGGTGVNTDETLETTGLNPPIIPYITKDSARASFKTVGKTSYNNEFQWGDVLTATYPLSGTISREFIPNPIQYYPSSGTLDGRAYDETAGASRSDPANCVAVEGQFNRHYVALRNRLEYHSRFNQNYAISSSTWNKDTQQLNLISIPSIAYGTRIRPGTISLKWYVSGTLVGELQDLDQNGELVETTGSSTGSIGGVVLYEEGFLLLTGSWTMSDERFALRNDVNTIDYARWIYFGAGANDGVNHTNVSTAYKHTFSSASFNISFEGQTDIQTYTFFAKARKGEVNYSNNPTFLEYGQEKIFDTGSNKYVEKDTQRIKNTVSSSYLDYTPPFKRQVFVSRVAIYDNNKNLIGVTTLANPVLKQEDQDYTFKIKLDI
jgi:hypothetical protein